MNTVAIAIFPFINLTDQNGTGILCKSLYIDLVTELSRFRQFCVIGCESPTKETHPFPTTTYSITGSFRFQAGVLTINAQLVNQQQIVWADRFFGSKEDIFSIQEDLLKQIVSTLQQQLHFDLLIHIRKKPAVNLNAYEHWLYGMEELKKGSLESDERARSHFQQAINLDPAFSLAYSGMSLTYFNEWSCQLWDRWEVSQKGAYEWARKAIYLDEQNYVACLVLGRVYLYEAEYKLAEHYLRRALRLNPNDLDNLIHTASCFVYLGYQEEAEELYQKVLQLHPLNSKTYHYIGSFIAFERGRFEECIALGAGSSSPWIDTPAVLAAAYYALGDLVNMEKYWAMFLKRFQEKIAKGESVAPETAAQWFIDVSPYKHTSRMRPFLEYIGKKQIFAPRQFYRTATDSAQHYFLKEGELWVLMFDGKSIRMPEVKGLYDLAKLIQYPEKPVHCTELMGGGVVSKPVPVLDEKAKRVYRKKILELQEEIQYSERNNDLLRTTQLQQEYDHVVSHLATSLGLHGRTRKVSGELEKVRSAVTWRIRHAIQKIKKNHPALGKHLSMSIKTGILCRYAPEKPMAWIVEDK